MYQLWGWTATDMFGRSREYQCDGADITESMMVEFLRERFPNVTLTNIRRLQPGDKKRPTGIIEPHTYHVGIYDQVLREKGMTPYTDMLRRQAQGIQRKPIERVPIIRSR